MKEHPILFSTPMIVAILEGRKTQTRRIIKLPAGFQECNEDNDWEFEGSPQWPHAIYKKTGCLAALPAPCNLVDRLWVRETFCLQTNIFGQFFDDRTPFYKADDIKLPVGHKWKPSIFMPRWASRITLSITDIRAEFLQDISEEDAKAEGIDTLHKGYDFPWKDYQLKTLNGCQTARDSYRSLWNSLNEKRGYGWDKNPGVWVYEFRKVDI